MSHSDEESDEANVVLWIVFSSLLLITSYKIYRFLKERPLFQVLVVKAKNTYDNFTNCKFAFSSSKFSCKKLSCKILFVQKQLNEKQFEVGCFTI